VARVAPPKRTAFSLSKEDASPALPGAVPVFERSDDGLYLQGAREGYERVVRDLRRGQWPLSDTLDLHGLTLPEAERAVLGFCARARGPEARAVLVVHGKGNHSPRGRGVLRDEIAVWLATVPLAYQVLCFVTARPEHGGFGALYVLLARERGGPGGRGGRGERARG